MYEKIWLAGLGAYARYEKLGQEGKRLFEELVEDGEDVRDRGSDEVDVLKEKAQEKINETIVRLKEIIHLDKNGDTRKLSHQIEELNKAVKALAAIERKTSASAGITAEARIAS